MKNIIRIFICLLVVSLISSKAYAQAELTGEVVYYDKCNDSQFPVSNAFDNDENTYFRSCAPFGNWIGLDLGVKHVITAVGYSPRLDSDYRDRLQLGIFQGANRQDFGDAIALYVIPDSTERTLTIRSINSSVGFRYVRFVFPYAQVDGKSSYMGELKFYGYASEGDNSNMPQLTNLPTISINTVNSQDIVSKEDYVKGIVSIVYENGTKFFTDSLEIRGRGNNSWTHPKKPYRMKLYNSTKLMGLPAKAKNWTLINNYGDKTLMRNMLAFDFSRKLEMPYTSPAVGVDVVLNGDYKGTYQLCDHIDVRPYRQDVEEMGPSDLTGGYAIEIDAYAYSEPKMFTSNAYGIPVTIKYPDDKDITLPQEQYIASHFNKFTSSVLSSNFSDVNNGFRRYLDEETFYRHFLVGEYAGNTDTYWSVRMYKKRDNEKFIISPVWDYDLGFENDWRTYPIMTNAYQTNDWVSFSSGSSGAGGTKDLVRRILSDPAALKRLEEVYAHYRNSVINKESLLALVDENASHLYQSQKLNFKRWRIMNVKVHENPVIYGSYEGEVNNVKRYIGERIDWMDSKLNYSAIPSKTLLTQANNNIRIATDNNAITITTLENYLINIYDLSGKNISSVNSDKNSTSNFNVRSGVYIIHFTSSDNSKNVYKCIVP